MSQPSTQSTQAVHEKLLVDPAQRDADWKKEFFDAIYDAAFELNDPQVLTGPDQFGYFVLKFPQPQKPFQAVSIDLVLDHCLDHGLGIVINPRPNAADWVFTFGNLWARRAYGTFETFVPEPKQPDPSVERQIMVGTPSEEFVPFYARNTLRRFLTEKVKLETPKVMMITDPEAAPDQSLAFNVFREECRDDQHFGAIMTYLRWFLPGHYGLVSIPKDAPFVERFFEL
ncbi:MAG: hypothetical protein IT349_06480 [Candidatus Eisenbacteria bacterium]|nr:hypothetical protein [Candidatus Eisenbacteria bacterium]MCC7141734.1 hypothetical protein [Candidatus Eisenbacteria bacterium]